MTATRFVKYPDSDPAMMDKYGLGGAAVVGNLVFAGGMAIDLETLRRPESAVTIADETRMCFEGIDETLGLVGCRMRDVAKITCYVSDPAYGPEMRDATKQIFAPGPYPKQITVVAGVAGDCRVEFEVLAVKPDEDRKGTS